MHRTHHCGELRLTDTHKKVILAGWVQRTREMGGMAFVDLRDRYGITQLAFNEYWDTQLLQDARKLHREYVIQVEGEVMERSNKNTELPTGAIEIKVTRLTVLNASKTPPFTIEDETDGGEELRMKYRYLDLRRPVVREKLLLRNTVGAAVRHFLYEHQFVEVETPYLIKSTPEGARDFVVPSRMNQGQFYALPQSPQTFKQLLMIGGIDRYFQIVKCFRDEDLRADRQPEFTQIDCELSFVEREDILQTFEEMLRHVLKQIKGVTVGTFPRLSYAQAMQRYGNDKPDIRFGMELCRLNEWSQHRGFKVFDDAELVVAICVEGAAHYTRKQLDALTAWVKRPQLDAGGLIWCKHQPDGTLKSSVDKFFDSEDLKKWAEVTGSQAGDLMLILAGPEAKTRKAMSELRLHLAQELGMRNPNEYAPLWVTDFPLLEWDEESKRYHAMHHPFTSALPEDEHLLSSEPGRVRANAYDLVLNGNEIGGGSIRIHDKEQQRNMLRLLGFSDEEARAQFGFLMDAFEYGAPPHGGIAFGFDRLVALLGEQENIRDFIAFPKNNAGRDLMIDAPATLQKEQLDELHLQLKPADAP